jgi:hypothetical protein
VTGEEFLRPTASPRVRPRTPSRGSSQALRHRVRQGTRYGRPEHPSTPRARCSSAATPPLGRNTSSGQSSTVTAALHAPHFRGLVSPAAGHEPTGPR